MWIPQGQALTLSSISPVAEHGNQVIDAQLSDRVTGKPGVLHSVESQRVKITEQQQKETHPR